MYKNVGFVRVVKSFFKRFFVHFFSLKKGGGGGVFHFLDLHNFYVQAQNFPKIIDMDSTRQELFIDMLHDIVFPTRF